MRRELLLLEEMIDAAEQAHLLAVGQTPESLAADRQRRDALLWNFTVLGEAAAQLPDDFKADHPEIPWQQPSRLRNRIVHGYWSIDLDDPDHDRGRAVARHSRQVREQEVDQLLLVHPSSGGVGRGRP